METKDFFTGPVTYDQKRGQGLFINRPDGAMVLVAVFATFPVVMKLPEFGNDPDGYYEARRFQDNIGEFVADAINEKVDAANRVKRADYQKLEAIDNLIIAYGGIDGAHHKQWVLDQIVRIKLDCPVDEETDSYSENEAYQKWIKGYEEGEDGPQTYSWDKGIAP